MRQQQIFLLFFLIKLNKSSVCDDEFKLKIKDKEINLNKYVKESKKISIKQISTSNIYKDINEIFDNIIKKIETNLDIYETENSLKEKIKKIIFENQNYQIYKNFIYSDCINKIIIFLNLSFTIKIYFYEENNLFYATILINDLKDNLKLNFVKKKIVKKKIVENKVKEFIENKNKNIFEKKKQIEKNLMLFDKKKKDNNNKLNELLDELKKLNPLEFENLNFNESLMKQSFKKSNLNQTSNYKKIFNKTNLNQTSNFRKSFKRSNLNQTSNYKKIFNKTNLNQKTKLNDSILKNNFKKKNNSKSNNFLKISNNSNIFFKESEKNLEDLEKLKMKINQIINENDELNNEKTEFKNNLKKLVKKEKNNEKNLLKKDLKTFLENEKKYKSNFIKKLDENNFNFLNNKNQIANINFKNKITENFYKLLVYLIIFANNNGYIKLNKLKLLFKEYNIQTIKLSLFLEILVKKYNYKDSSIFSIKSILIIFVKYNLLENYNLNNIKEEILKTFNNMVEEYKIFNFNEFLIYNEEIVTKDNFDKNLKNYYLDDYLINEKKIENLKINLKKSEIKKNKKEILKYQNELNDLIELQKKNNFKSNYWYKKIYEKSEIIKNFNLKENLNDNKEINEFNFLISNSEEFEMKLKIIFYNLKLKKDIDNLKENSLKFKFIRIFNHNNVLFKYNNDELKKMDKFIEIFNIEKFKNTDYEYIFKNNINYLFLFLNSEEVFN